MYSFDSSAQPLVLFMSLGAGFALGLIYDIFRLIRLTFTKSKAAVFLFDILYFAVFAAASYLFIFAVNKGEVRLYIILAEIAGAAVYYFSFGAAAMRVTNAVVSGMHRFANSLFKVISLPFKAANKAVLNFKQRILKKYKKMCSKIKFFLQKHLKKLRLCVYNLFGVLFRHHKSQTERNADIEQPKKN